MYVRNFADGHASNTHGLGNQNSDKRVKAQIPVARGVTSELGKMSLFKIIENLSKRQPLLMERERPLVTRRIPIRN